jgi:hypothetical protein
VAWGQGVAASVGATVIPQDVETALHQMSDRAGVIFVGQVAAVRRQVGSGAGQGVVEVEFRVDQAIRGCVAGSPYTLREWAGLWEGSDQRYRVGQRLLMLLHSPSPAGMSSPVDGLDGAIPIVRGGSVPLAANSSARVRPPAVDLRWVGTKMLRTVSYAGNSAQQLGGAIAKPQTVGGVAGGSAVQAAPVTVLSAAGRPGSASVPTQQASVDAVVGMLTSWQKVQHEVR